MEGDVWMCEGGMCGGKNLVICTQVMHMTSCT